jgi:hypothetical protein
MYKQFLSCVKHTVIYYYCNTLRYVTKRIAQLKAVRRHVQLTMMRTDTLRKKSPMSRSRFYRVNLS